MAKSASKSAPLPAPVIQPIELACAADDIALQITRWLAHLRSERRLSPKT
jgi:integrase/recombinase XerC